MCMMYRLLDFELNALNLHLHIREGCKAKAPNKIPGDRSKDHAQNMNESCFIPVSGSQGGLMK